MLQTTTNKVKVSIKAYKPLTIVNDNDKLVIARLLLEILANILLVKVICREVEQFVKYMHS